MRSNRKPRIPTLRINDSYFLGYSPWTWNSKLTINTLESRPSEFQAPGLRTGRVPSQ